jgi:hypothetical protein
MGLYIRKGSDIHADYAGSIIMSHDNSSWNPIRKSEVISVTGVFFEGASSGIDRAIVRIQTNGREIPINLASVEGHAGWTVDQAGVDAAIKEINSWLN